MKRFCVIFCVVILIGCSTFGSIKLEDINDIEARVQQLALIVGPHKDIDKAIDLLDKAKLAFAIADKVKAKEYKDAALIIVNTLEGK